MSHITLTCENHRNLLWSAKSQAITRSGRYTGARRIFFVRDTNKPHPDAPDIECSCSPNLLIAVDMTEVEKAYNEGCLGE